MTSLIANSQSTSDPLEIYNVGTITPNGNNGYTRPYSVVLGICDPILGTFQEMWDFVSVSYPVDNSIPSQPPCGHGMMMAKDNPITVEKYVKDKNISSASSEKNIVLSISGEVSLNNNKLEIIKPLTCYYSYKYEVKSFEFIEKSIDINEGDILLADCTPDNHNLFVKKESDNLSSDSNIYIVGIVKNNRFSALMQSITVGKNS